jgi:hypothetical protein
MSHSIPCNELEAIGLMADAALAVHNALGDRKESMHYYSDSMIAVCWVLNNKSRRLRMFVHNRVQSIQHGIRQIVDGNKVIPLYHIDGNSNIADMITKPRRVSVSDVQHDSQWMCGLPWMRLPTEDLPKSQFGFLLRPEDEQAIAQEQFPDTVVHLADLESRELLLRTPSADQSVVNSNSFFTDNPCRPRKKWLQATFDFIDLGWSRAYNRLKLVVKALILILHRRHDPSAAPEGKCSACRGNLSDEITQRADAAVFQAASNEVAKALGARAMEKQFMLNANIWYASQRLQKEGGMEVVQDLDFKCFYDSVSIKKVLPLVLVKSEIFYALMLHVHFVELPHARVEVTLARIKQRMYPVGHA